MLKFKVDASGLVSSGRSVNHLVTLGNGLIGLIGIRMLKHYFFKVDESNCFNFHAAKFLEIVSNTVFQGHVRKNPSVNESPLDRGKFFQLAKDS